MIKVWRYWIVRPKALFIASQAALVAALLLIAVWVHQSRVSRLEWRDHAGWMALLLIPQLCFYFNGLETLSLAPDRRLYATKVIAAMGLGLILTVPLFVLFPSLFPGVPQSVAAVLVSALMIVGLRPLLQLVIRRKKFVEGLLVLGTGDTARKFYTELAGGRRRGRYASSSGTLADHVDCPEPFEDSGEAIGYDKLREITVRDHISRIVVTEPGAHSDEALAAALLDCKLRGLEVEHAIESYERLNDKVWLEALHPEWLVYSEGFRPSRYYLRFKRVFDATCALLLLIVAAIPFAIISVLIRWDSEGPVLFRQVRVGLNGRRFVLYKFRTMRPDAEHKTGPVWATEKDDRVTRVGKYLRKFRLDELPQIFNVIRGEMSLVGPRPERPHFVELLNKHIRYYNLRHSVKPGITGWAQVLYPYGASVQDAYEKLQYDLYYAEHMSLALDLRILFRTVKVVLFGRGR
ncbi:MAG: exopolysaccharide biosynthesis polyprenyl glycosylphosphotransferase [Acidobacteria bacterium]|nr:exopolysaccharide biosynthesis polyprenyl glycosylphosphotransferase [Acidobacteriota bacterium]